MRRHLRNRSLGFIPMKIGVEKGRLSYSTELLRHYPATSDRKSNADLTWVNDF